MEQRAGSGLAVIVAISVQVGGLVRHEQGEALHAGVRWSGKGRVAALAEENRGIAAVEVGRIVEGQAVAAVAAELASLPGLSLLLQLLLSSSSCDLRRVGQAWQALRPQELAASEQLPTGWRQLACREYNRDLCSARSRSSLVVRLVEGS